MLIWSEFGFSPVLTFCIVITMLWLYDMAAARKKQELLDAYFAKSGVEQLKKSAQQGYLLDLTGHTVGEIAWGAVLGIILGTLAILFVLSE